MWILCWYYIFLYGSVLYVSVAGEILILCLCHSSFGLLLRIWLCVSLWVGCNPTFGGLWAAVTNRLQLKMVCDLEASSESHQPATHFGGHGVVQKSDHDTQVENHCVTWQLKRIVSPHYLEVTEVLRYFRLQPLGFRGPPYPLEMMQCVTKVRRLKTSALCWWRCLVPANQGANTVISSSPYYLPSLVDFKKWTKCRVFFSILIVIIPFMYFLYTTVSWTKIIFIWRMLILWQR